MKKLLLLRSFFSITLCALGVPFLSIAQQYHAEGGGEVENHSSAPCLGEAQYIEIETAIKLSMDSLTQAGVLPIAQTESAVLFDLPLEKANNLVWNNAYVISGYVDQDTSSGTQDYNCFSRTYDGHHGTDYASWPFPWHLKGNDLLHVVAAADGVIVQKHDGNTDDNCSWTQNQNWNAVYVAHADGTVAWYGHLKANSLTGKLIGQSVTAGEYLGVVASSGRSSGPHLHFELQDSMNNVLDPYLGGCNTGGSLWNNQETYRVPTINAALTHDAPPVFGCPVNNEQPNLQNVFGQGATMYTAIYLRDQLTSDTISLIIKRPDNSVWQTWTNSTTVDYTQSYWYWSWYLPAAAQLGTWSFEVTLNGNTVIHNFDVVLNSPLDIEEFHLRAYKVNEDNALTWSVLSDVQLSTFEIERSLDGLFFTKIGDINVNPILEEKQYSFLDKISLETAYYRVKAVDENNETYYSNIASLSGKNNGKITLVPLPSKGAIRIQGLDGKKYNVKVLSINGQLIHEESIVAMNGQADLSWSNQPKGVYIIRLQNIQSNHILVDRFINGIGE